MVVERDHGRSGVARRRLGDEVVEQVGVAAVEAVEDADDDEDRAELGPQRIDPLRRRPSRRQPTGRPPRRGGRDEDLVRREPAAWPRRDRRRARRPRRASR